MTTTKTKGLKIPPIIWIILGVIFLLNIPRIISVINFPDTIFVEDNNDNKNNIDILGTITENKKTGS